MNVLGKEATLQIREYLRQRRQHWCSQYSCSPGKMWCTDGNCQLKKIKKLLINIINVATLKDNNIAACVSLMPDQISTAFRYSNWIVCVVVKSGLGSQVPAKSKPQWNRNIKTYTLIGMSKPFPKQTIQLFRILFCTQAGLNLRLMRGWVRGC